MTPSASPRRRLAAGMLLLGVVLALASCGSDDDADRATDAAGGASHDTTHDTGWRPDPTTSTDAPPDGVVEVDLADFAFVGLPDSVPVGTRLTITNSSPVELHKLSALPLPEGEDRSVEERSVEELLALPGAEQAAILRVTPATVLVAGPGGPQVNEIGDGTLTAPGRYLLICAVPVGQDPDEYLDALQDDGRRPQISGEGAPHFRLGMVADLTVE